MSERMSEQTTEGMSEQMRESFVDIALLAFGGPETTALVPQFLERMTGRTPEAEVVAAVSARYEAIRAEDVHATFLDVLERPWMVGRVGIEPTTN